MARSARSESACASRVAAARRVSTPQHRTADAKLRHRLIPWRAESLRLVATSVPAVGILLLDSVTLVRPSRTKRVDHGNVLAEREIPA